MEVTLLPTPLLKRGKTYDFVFELTNKAAMIQSCSFSFQYFTSGDADEASTQIVIQPLTKYIKDQGIYLAFVSQLRGTTAFDVAPGQTIQKIFEIRLPGELKGKQLFVGLSMQIYSDNIIRSSSHQNSELSDANQHSDQVSAQSEPFQTQCRDNVVYKYQKQFTKIFRLGFPLPKPIPIEELQTVNNGFIQTKIGAIPARVQIQNVGVLRISTGFILVAGRASELVLECEEQPEPQLKIVKPGLREVSFNAVAKAGEFIGQFRLFKIDHQDMNVQRITKRLTIQLVDRDAVMLNQVYDCCERIETEIGVPERFERDTVTIRLCVGETTWEKQIFVIQE